MKQITFEVIDRALVERGKVFTGEVVEEFINAYRVKTQTGIVLALKECIKVLDIHEV